MEKAVALVSGGIKSAVMVAAERERCDLLLLHVHTGSRASAAEQAAFVSLCRKWDIPKPAVVSVAHLTELIDHPEFDTEVTPGTHGMAWEDVEGYVPGLMLALLDVAVLHALRDGARRILVGASEPPTATPRLGPPAADQRKEFYQAYNDMLATLMPISSPAVYAPMIDVALPEIIKLGQRLRAPLELTWSCMATSHSPCGRCAGCRSRAMGFLQAGMADPATARPGQ